MNSTPKKPHSTYVLKAVFISAVLFILSCLSVKAYSADSEGEELNPGELIFEHVLDNHIWHFFDGHYGTLYLPVIIYTPEKGIEVFSSRKFYDEHHNTVPYNGYSLEHGHIYSNQHPVLDLSITKNVLTLFILAILLVLIFRAVANGYKKNEGQAPSGIQSFLEPVILYVKDEIVKPNISHNHEKYLPYLLTLFFFILC